MSKKQKILMAGAALFAALLLFSGIMVCREIKDSRQSAQAFETLAKLGRVDKVFPSLPNYDKMRAKGVGKCS